jgi:hypothetical protein
MFDIASLPKTIKRRPSLYLKGRKLDQNKAINYNSSLVVIAEAAICGIQLDESTNLLAFDYRQVLKNTPERIQEIYGENQIAHTIWTSISSKTCFEEVEYETNTDNVVFIDLFSSEEFLIRLLAEKFDIVSTNWTLNTFSQNILTSIETMTRILADGEGSERMLARIDFDAIVKIHLCQRGVVDFSEHFSDFFLRVFSQSTPEPPMIVCILSGDFLCEGSQYQPASTVIDGDKSFFASYAILCFRFFSNPEFVIVYLDSQNNYKLHYRERASDNCDSLFRGFVFNINIELYDNIRNFGIHMSIPATNPNSFVLETVLLFYGY